MKTMSGSMGKRCTTGPTGPSGSGGRSTKSGGGFGKKIKGFSARVGKRRGKFSKGPAR